MLYNQIFYNLKIVIEIKNASLQYAQSFGYFIVFVQKHQHIYIIRSETLSLRID